jgi:hypothetical protein
LSEASQLGYAVNRRELQLWANHHLFDRDGWPWIGKSRQARMAFFEGSAWSTEGGFAAMTVEGNPLKLNGSSRKRLEACHKGGGGHG